jgi:DNA invertase Pin-like site-specific DNA recombinase
MKKAIILARVSTPEQQKSGLSIEEIQLPQMRQYALDNNMEVSKEHEFVFQETASQKLRKKFDEMIEFVKENDEIEAIIAFRVDRMTRNYRDAVEMDTLRTEYKKELHFVNDRLVLDERSVGRDIQDWDLKVFLAKQHINRCQEDAQNTLMSKLKSGEQYGNYSGCI